MRIDNEFTVDAPVERVWDLLTDVEAIAPCMPGAQLTGVESGQDWDVYSGTVKVKVGPVVAAYQGTAWFSEKDDEARTAVVEASGKASRGAGNAAGSVVIELREVDGGTLVTLRTSLKITGKLAQLGSGMIKDVSERLLGQFVGCLEGKLAAPAEESPERARTGSDQASTVAEAEQGAESVDGAEAAEQGPPPVPGFVSGNGSDPKQAVSAVKGRAEETEEAEARGSASGVEEPGDKTEHERGTDEVEPFDLGRASGGAIAQRVWPVLAVMVVIAGIIVGYVVFG